MFHLANLNQSHPNFNYLNHSPRFRELDLCFDAVCSRDKGFTWTATFSLTILEQKRVVKQTIWRGYLFPAIQRAAAAINFDYWSGAFRIRHELMVFLADLVKWFAAILSSPMHLIDFLHISDDDDATTSGVTLDDVEKRVIFLNQTQPQKFCNNHISTAKYK